MKSAQRTSQPLLTIRKRLYSIPEGAVYLGRTVWAVREMIYAGKISYIRDGRRMLLDIDDMNKWIDASKTRFEY